MSLHQLRTGKIAVLLGGSSGEREVSLNSGQTVIEALQSLNLDVIAIDPSQPDWRAKLDGVSVAFIVLHGPGGEDGSMQGALQTLGIPYTGSGVLGSALAMDKPRSKQLWQGIDLATAGFVTLAEDTDWQGVIDRFGKVFVKPASEGSSLGMSIAGSASALRESYTLASQYAGEVLAEQFIAGPEYTVAILGDQALPSIRLETDNAFYDYEAKYVSNDTRYHIPSGLSDSEEAEIAALSLRAFRSLGCAVWGRVDVMRDADGRFWVLEVNTVPGMTSHSLVPMAAAAAGMAIPELVQRILELSLAGKQ
ncbi:D-alanine--D-alanine ligase B [Halioglobus japonicus]|nr:D-alanine--D-alanine ligase B [Halioglobus japonicus]